MEIIDKVYGKVKIEDFVLIELINLKSIQRIKGVSQFGLPDKYYHKKGFSRYDHSVGVFLLLRKLGANLNEQIAGLLHDVSHTAFSHVVDWVVGLGDPTKEKYQDQLHLETIKNSEIPFVLEKHGIDYSVVSNLENFSLLERESPSLCADRIDYSLRELVQEGKFEIVNNLVANLINFNGQIVFKDKDLAEIFAEEHMRLQKEHWAGEQARVRYYLLGRILREALDKKIISMSDLMKTDEEVLSLLIKSKDKEILNTLGLLEGGFSVVESEKGIELKKKFRCVDPEVLIGDSINLLSELSLKYEKFINAEKQNSNSFKKILIIENEHPTIF